MKKFLLGMVAGIAIVSLVACGQQVTERSKKDQESANNGLNRTLEVYSHDGKLIKKYEGTFDLEWGDGGKVKFDLEGKRHIIYNAIVITDEK
jgi:hypothetical protein